MNRQNLMNASTYYTKCKFFLSPGSYNSNSLSSNLTVSQNYYANSLSSYLSLHLSNKECNIAPNTSVQHQALNLIKEAKAKASKYE
ncbi:11699_t:CDS:2, partial [Dentiscutata heterogama]